MSVRRTTGSLVAIIVACLSGAPDVSAQPDDMGPRCRHDEIDMGDYCASLKPPDTEEEASTRRVTPFRSRSMMPGLVAEEGETPPSRPEPANSASQVVGPAASPVVAPQESPASQAVRTPASPVPARQVPPEPELPVRAPVEEPAAIPAGGFGVQFGVFSSRESARRIAQPLADAGLDVGLAKMERSGRLLWACIHGPFADRPAAEAAADRLAIDHSIPDTYIKTLDDLELTGLSHATTQE